MGERRAAGPGRRRAAKPRGGTHTVAKVLGASLVALALLTGLSVTLVYRHLNGNIEKQDISALLGDDRPEVTGPTGALNVLVLGSDSRQGQGNKIDNEAPGGSDTTILMHLSANRKSAYGISIPRDSVVRRPECFLKNGQTAPAEEGAQWNAAYNVGGPACTQRQFEQLTGIRVDNYVVVDFAGFKSMVDAVGGVEICTPDPINDEKSGLDLEAGTQTITGDQALAYVRTRESVGDGSDLGRIKRQQAFVAAMAAKIVSGGVLANPIKVVTFLDAATKSLTTDFGGLKDIAGLGRQFNGVGLNRIQFITVPIADDPEDPNRVVWTDAADDLWGKVANDASLGKLREGAITAADQPSGTPATGSASGSTPTTSPSTSPSASPSDSSGPSAGPPSATTGLDADQREAVGLCST